MSDYAYDINQAISLTRLDGWPMIVNMQDVSRIEKEPDVDSDDPCTIIHFKNGDETVVEESIRTIEARLSG